MSTGLVKHKLFSEGNNHRLYGRSLYRNIDYAGSAGLLIPLLFKNATGISFCITVMQLKYVFARQLLSHHRYIICGK